MQADLHNDMRQIIDKSLVGEASPEEQQALRKHLLACAACQKYASDSRRAIVSLSGFPSPSPQTPACRQRSTPPSICAHSNCTPRSPAAGASSRSASSLFCSPSSAPSAHWHIGSPLAALLHLEPAQMQTGVVALWVLPSLCFSLVLPVLLLLSARSAKAKGSVL